MVFWQIVGLSLARIAWRKCARHCQKEDCNFGDALKCMNTKVLERFSLECGDTNVLQRFSVFCFRRVRLLQAIVSILSKRLAKHKAKTMEKRLSDSYPYILQFELCIPCFST